MTVIPDTPAHFQRFLGAAPRRRHVAAHSHHPWPDVTFVAQQQAWLDAALHHDAKWDHVVGTVVPEAQRHITGRLGLPDPSTIAFAPNTHEFVVRLLSTLPRPARILTSDAEFHSLTRQLRRMAEDGLVRVEWAPAEPLGTFADRFCAATAAGGHDLVVCSHVFFNSGGVAVDPAELAAAVPDDTTLVLIDGYHGFMALPTDLSAVNDRVFYVAGGYKYAMAGEGAAFLHVPPGYAPRPLNTGWFAAFSALADPQGRVSYASDGSRFLGATFDPTGLYRFNAVQRLLDELRIDVAAIQAHVGALQNQFLDALDGLGRPWLSTSMLVPEVGALERGHFLTFRTPLAVQINDALRAAGVVADVREDRLRIGFGLYHQPDDIDELCRRLVGIRVPSTRG